MLGAVLRVPELGNEEEVLALDAELGESPLQCVRDLLLVAVDLGEVNVLVTSLECLKDSSLDLARLGLPRSKTQLTIHMQLATRLRERMRCVIQYLRDGGAGVELDGSSERHFEVFLCM